MATMFRAQFKDMTASHVHCFTIILQV